MAADGVVEDTTNGVVGEVDEAIQCFTTTRPLITITIGRTAMATLHISRGHFSNAIHINLSKDMVATIRVLGPHQTMVEQHIIILWRVEVLQVEADPLQVHNITLTPGLVEAIMDRAAAGLAATIAAMEAMSEGATVVTVVMGRHPTAMAATEVAEAHTMILGVEVGVDIDTDNIC